MKTLSAWTFKRGGIFRGKIHILKRKQKSTSVSHKNLIAICGYELNELFALMEPTKDEPEDDCKRCFNIYFK